MGDVAVENPANTVFPHKKSASNVPGLDPLEMSTAGDAGDEYQTYKKLQRELEYIQLQEEYIKDEQRQAATPHPAGAHCLQLTGVSSGSLYEHKKRSSGYKVFP
jgi:hypothetical protein